MELHSSCYWPEFVLTTQNFNSLQGSASNDPRVTSVPSFAYSWHVSAEGAQAIVEGLLAGESPIEELSMVDNPMCLSGAVVKRHKADMEREAELKKLANVSRPTPASEWAKMQLQTRVALPELSSKGCIPVRWHFMYFCE